jgi:hypothetical protein
MMSRILCTPSLKVKPTRRTARPSAPFGSGILPTRRTRKPRFEPTAADAAWASQTFGVDADWDAHLTAGFQHCEVCNRPVAKGALVGGLCDRCEARAEDATMASGYFAAGLAYAAH